MESEKISRRAKISAIVTLGLYRPGLTASIVGFGLLVGALEGIGLGFILPIIEVARGEASGTASGPVRVFAEAYALLGIPFTIEYIVVGVTLVIGVRYTSSFLMSWLAAILRIDYIRTLRTQASEKALDARVDYFDREGSDEILNAIITQTSYAGGMVHHTVRILELTLTSAAYVAVALYLAPLLMIVTGIVIGVIMFGIRTVLESGYSVGGRVADANERVQEAVQAGMQGIRDVKIFRLTDEILMDLRDAVDQYTEARITQRRNQVAINQFNQFLTAVTVFVLIYIGLEFSALSLGGLGVFLFAMFRLGPKLSSLNDVIYQAESDLPHLIRTQEFMDRLDANREPSGERPVPTPVRHIAFEDVEFEYASENKTVLRGVSFDVWRGEFTAFVGPSGAGKSTIVSLLARMYEPTGGQITADSVPIGEFDIDEWRARVSIVRQNPFVFNESLRYNVTVGKRDASQEEISRVCEIAQVTEFLDDLPDGYDTKLGDDGVRLSGGQRQRIAIARALLKDADLLVLDEATSDLDSHLEERVHRGIENLDRNYGIIAIAHRLSTVTDADRIHMMEDGEIVETGTHHELVAKEGKYAALYTTQSSTS